MIQINAEHSLSLHFINASSTGQNDIKTFVNFIKVCKAEADKPGFRNMFDDAQKVMIEEIHNKITT